jgi:hypothetical protein
MNKFRQVHDCKKVYRRHPPVGVPQFPFHVVILNAILNAHMFQVVIVNAHIFPERSHISSRHPERSEDPCISPLLLLLQVPNLPTESSQSPISKHLLNPTQSLSSPFLVLDQRKPNMPITMFPKPDTGTHGNLGLSQQLL